jgi:hypothetical protein
MSNGSTTTCPQVAVALATCGSQHVELVVIAVTEHQPVAMLIELIGELLDMGGDFDLQRCGQHLPGTVVSVETVRVSLPKVPDDEEV